MFYLNIPQHLKDSLLIDSYIFVPTKPHYHDLIHQSPMNILYLLHTLLIPYANKKQ